MTHLSKRQLRQLIAAILKSENSSFFILFNQEGAIEYARGRLFEAVEHDVSELAGQYLEEAFPAESNDHALKLAFDRALEGETISTRFPVGQFNVAWQLYPLSFESRPYVLALAVPLSEAYEMMLDRADGVMRDEQTGALTRLAISRHIENIVEQGTSAGWSLLRVRITGLRTVNRSYGQDMGDMVLRYAMLRLEGEMSQGDHLGRASGNEFVILIRTDGPKAVKDLVERLDHLFDEPFEAEDQQFLLGIQVGIALFPNDATSAPELMRRATVALERARHAGIAHAFFDEDWEHDIASADWLPAALRTALKKQQFELHFQPLVDSENRECQWLETLIRWRHPKHGLISPGLFISVAEEMRLMQELDLWVLEQACLGARELGMPVAVNLSPSTLTAPDFLLELDKRIEASGIPANWLTLEITERTFADPDATRPLMEAVRERDVLIAIDDFGVGYSSLAYLWQFPVDEVKLDGAFIRAVATNDQASEVIRGMVPMARELGIKLVAEGVETEEQATWLADCGVGYQQGYFHCRPGPIDTIRQHLEEMAN